MAVTAILFDKDGTLIDFDATWGRATYEVLYSLSEGDRDVLSRLAEVTCYDLNGRKIHHESALVGDSPMELAQLWASIVGREAGPVFEREIDQMFTEQSLKQLTGFEATEPALEILRQKGFILGIATNDAQETAEQHMQQLGWEHHFEVIYGYNSGHGPKPQPGMVKAFERHTGVPADQIVMVGDSLHDMEAGRRAGAYSIGVRTGPWGGRQLVGHADAVIDSLDDLVACLDGSPFCDGGA